MPLQGGKLKLLSFPPKVVLVRVVLEHWSLIFTTLPQEATQMEFHTSYHMNQRSSHLHHSKVDWLHSTVCSEYVRIWLISLFGLLWCGPTSYGVGGHFENGAWGMTQQQGVQPVFLLAPLSLEPSGKQRGVKMTVKRPTCLGTWKGWLTIPFEATRYKGAGHWQVRTKDLIVYFF